MTGLLRKKVPGDYYLNYEMDSTGVIWYEEDRQVDVHHEYTTGLATVVLIRKDGGIDIRRILDIWMEIYGDDYRIMSTLIANMIGKANKPIKDRKMESSNDMIAMHEVGGYTLEQLGEVFGIRHKSYVKLVLDNPNSIAVEKV